jgi:hypothetical protein
MATTLQQLLDALTEETREPTPSVSIDDTTGALAHLGRALTGLTHDGLTPADSSRQRTVTELGAACTTAGRLWPPTRRPLTDLAGAAADLIGRDRAAMGRSHRWAVTVELAAAADHCARLGRRLQPQAAVAELAAICRLAAGVERDAQTDQPTAAGAVVLDRLVPLPAVPNPDSAVTAADTCGVLVAALERTRRTAELTVREFRAAVAAVEVSSRCTAAVTAATSGGDAGPLLVTAHAWQLAGRLSTAFDDGRRTAPTDPRGIVPAAQALADALRADIGPAVGIAALRDRDDLASLGGTVQQVANQLPVLADQLTRVVDQWSRTGQLFANARDLPPMEDMPEDRIRAVIAGRHVPAVGPDLNLLRHAVGRAAALSTALADTLNRPAPTGASRPRHLADRYVEQARAPGAAQCLLKHAQAVTEGLAATRTPLAGPGPCREDRCRPGL